MTKDEWDRLVQAINRIKGIVEVQDDFSRLKVRLNILKGSLVYVREHFLLIFSANQRWWNENEWDCKAVYMRRGQNELQPFTVLVKEVNDHAASSQ